MSETWAEEVRRLQAEITERQARLHRLVLGDPSVRVTVPNLPWYPPQPAEEQKP